MFTPNHEGSDTPHTDPLADAHYDLAFLEYRVSSSGKRALKRRWETHWRRLSAQRLIAAWNDMLQQVGVCRLIEIGAHAAENSIDFASRGGKAIALEANPHVYNSLTLGARASGVDTRQVAVAATSGFLDLRIPSQTHDDASPPQDASFLKQSVGKDFTVCTVPTTTLDAIFQDLEPDPLTALWIDAEGTTFDVLQGGKRSLTHGPIALIFAELETEAIWEGQRTANEVASYLSSLGFLPVIRDSEKADQFNCIFVKADYLELCKESAANYWGTISRLNFRSLKMYVRMGLTKRMTRYFN